MCKERPATDGSYSCVALHAAPCICSSWLPLPLKYQLCWPSKPCYKPPSRPLTLVAARMAALAALALQAFIAACGLAFLAFLLIQPSDKYDRSTVPDSLAISELEGRSVLEMVMTWGTVLAATLAALLLRRALAPRPAAAPSAVLRKVRGGKVAAAPCCMLRVPRMGPMFCCCMDVGWAPRLVASRLATARLHPGTASHDSPERPRLSCPRR